MSAVPVWRNELRSDLAERSHLRIRRNEATGIAGVSPAGSGTPAIPGPPASCRHLGSVLLSERGRHPAGGPGGLAPKLTAACAFPTKLPGRIGKADHGARAGAIFT